MLLFTFGSIVIVTIVLCFLSGARESSSGRAGEAWDGEAARKLVHRTSGHLEVRPEPTLCFEWLKSPGHREAPEFLDAGFLLREWGGCLSPPSKCCCTQLVCGTHICLREGEVGGGAGRGNILCFLLLCFFSERLSIA